MFQRHSIKIELQKSMVYLCVRVEGQFFLESHTRNWNYEKPQRVVYADFQHLPRLPILIYSLFLSLSIVDLVFVPSQSHKSLYRSLCTVVCSYSCTSWFYINFIIYFCGKWKLKTTYLSFYDGCNFWLIPNPCRPGILRRYSGLCKMLSSSQLNSDSS